MPKTSKNYPLVSIVTVAYKDDKYLSGLLLSIKQLDYPKESLEIIVVFILGSQKNITISGIPIQHISISKRVGYSKAVNIGISKSNGQYLFLPNPDTIIEKSALKNLVIYLREHEDVGIVGPKVFSMDDASKISPFDLPCKYFNKTTGKVLQIKATELAAITKPQEVYWLCGNGIVVRKTVWKLVKKYDESFFLYWEDADFNMKVRRKGYKSVLIPQAKLFHKGSGSVEDTDDQVYYIVRNGRYFFNKYCSLTGRCLIHLASFLVIISKSFQIFLRGHDKIKSQAFIEGILDFYKGKKGIRERIKH